MAMEAILFVVFLALLVINVPIGVALGTIAGILAVSVIASLLFPKKPAGDAAGGGTRP